MNARLVEYFKRKASKDVFDYGASSGVRPSEMYSNYKTVVDYEKFVELVVKECTRLIRSTDLEDVEGGDSAVLMAASEQIEKYFGIEK